MNACHACNVLRPSRAPSEKVFLGLVYFAGAVSKVTTDGTNNDSTTNNTSILINIVSSII